MWVELLCGLVIFKIFKRFFYDDDTFDVETTDSDSKFAVGRRMEKLYGGKVYLGLRIPDPDTGSRQNIDMVVVTKREAIVINVENISGVVGIDTDGSWMCTGQHRHQVEKRPDPVVETKRQVAILESYLEQRGIALPEGYISAKVVLPNPKSISNPSINFPPEVIPFDQWIKLKPDTSTSMVPGWIKGAFRGGKKEMQESIQEQLHSVLFTAPKWDRLELKESRNIFGEFLEFKGKPEDVHALGKIKRSKVSRLIVQKISMLGLASSRVQVLYCARDYRNEGSSTSDWKEVQVRAHTQVLFRPQNSNEVRKVKLSSVTCMSLSA